MDPETLEFKTLPLRGFAGTGGDGLINVVGFAGVDKPDGSIELFLTNLRPSTDPSTGRVLSDQAATGANATIEVFKTGGPAAEALEWVATFADPIIATPNRPAVVEGRGIYITNDHGQRKTGMVSLARRGSYHKPCRGGVQPGLAVLHAHRLGTDIFVFPSVDVDAITDSEYGRPGFLLHGSIRSVQDRIIRTQLS